MKKRFMSAFLAVIMLFSMLSTTAFAASSEEEALGEINIFNGGVTMSYLSTPPCQTIITEPSEHFASGMVKYGFTFRCNQLRLRE